MTRVSAHTTEKYNVGRLARHLVQRRQNVGCVYLLDLSHCVTQSLTIQSHQSQTELCVVAEIQLLVLQLAKDLAHSGTFVALDLC